MVVLVFLIALALRLQVNLISLFFIVPIVALVSMVPISLNGIGVKEFMYILLFQQVGLSFESGLVISFLARLLSVFGSIVGGVAYLITEGLHSPGPVGTVK